MEVTIRKALESDLSAIYKLVKELAVYEREPNAVTATLEEYRNDFRKGIFKAHVAVLNEEVVGMAIYYITYSTWKGRMLYLEDFIITLSQRRKGIGQRLFDAVVKEARHLKAKLLKWQVLEWNLAAIKFYERNNAIIETEWNNCKIYLNAE